MGDLVALGPRSPADPGNPGGAESHEESERIRAELRRLLVDVAERRARRKARRKAAEARDLATTDPAEV